MRPLRTENASQHRSTSTLRELAAHFSTYGYTWLHTPITWKCFIRNNSKSILYSNTYLTLAHVTISYRPPSNSSNRLWKLYPGDRAEASLLYIIHLRKKKSARMLISQPLLGYNPEVANKNFYAQILKNWKLHNYPTHTILGRYIRYGIVLSQHTISSTKFRWLQKSIKKAYHFQARKDCLWGPIAHFVRSRPEKQFLTHPKSLVMPIPEKFSFCSCPLLVTHEPALLQDKNYANR